jgi:hypothetical protein
MLPVTAESKMDATYKIMYAMHRLLMNEETTIEKSNYVPLIKHPKQYLSKKSVNKSCKTIFSKRMQWYQLELPINQTISH